MLAFWDWFNATAFVWLLIVGSIGALAFIMFRRNKDTTDKEEAE